ncbi:MAG TPA: plastocyanin/azurin family copper-binding protein [Verrucomicrobiae bacterium]|nr:plastocyanin/azurin family copper-binding protein [Verrucomicrobiae bacterium]
MPKKSIFIPAAILTVGLAGAFFIFQKDKPEQVASTQTSQPPAAGHVHAHSTTTAPLEDLTGQTEVTIDIKDSGYVRPNVKIKKGTKVTWINKDTLQHNVMKEHDHSDEAHEAPRRDEVKPDVFAGPLLAQGESYSFTFSVVGTFPYHCAPHPFMTGSITVVE